MISIKYNKKGQLINAPGKRKMAYSMYKPTQTDDYTISRSKFEDFLKCPACFHLDRVNGLISPGVPPWTLNSLTDSMLKRELDEYRERQEPHPILTGHGLSHIVPYQHPDLEKWRDSLHGGLQARVPNSNIIIKGGIDDLWVNTGTNELVVADYKSTGSQTPIDPETYFSEPYHKAYQTQLEFYSYLLDLMGFPVSNVGYLLVVRAIDDPIGFFGQMHFEQTIVPCVLDASWIKDSMRDLIDVLNSPELPASNPACENCAWDRERALIE